MIVDATEESAEYRAQPHARFMAYVVARVEECLIFAGFHPVITWTCEGARVDAERIA